LFFSGITVLLQCVFAAAGDVAIVAGAALKTTVLETADLEKTDQQTPPH